MAALDVGRGLGEALLSSRSPGNLGKSPCLSLRIFPIDTYLNSNGD